MVFLGSRSKPAPGLKNFAVNQCRGQDYELFLTVYKSRRRWSDRIREFELPLFPGYRFCRFNPPERPRYL